MKKQVFEGTWEEIYSYAEELSGRRVRITILDDEESPTLDQTLSELLKAAETLELEEQHLMPPDFFKNTGRAFTDVVINKYKKQGFNF